MVCVTMLLSMGCSSRLADRPALPTAIPGIASSDILYQTPEPRVKRTREPGGPTSTPAPWATELPPTPLPPPPAMGHDAGENVNCFECHYKGAYVPIPADHMRRKLNTCLGCHKPEPPWRTPFITHSIAGRQECLACHLQGQNSAPVEPGDHVGRMNDSCQSCHKIKEN